MNNPHLKNVGIITRKPHLAFLHHLKMVVSCGFLRMKNADCELIQLDTGTKNLGHYEQNKSTLSGMDNDAFTQLIKKLLGAIGLEITSFKFEDENYDIRAKVGESVPDSDFSSYLIRVVNKGENVAPEELQDFITQGRGEDSGLIFITTSFFSDDAKRYAKEFEIEVVDNEALGTMLKKSGLLKEVMTYRDSKILKGEIGRYLPSIDELENIIESGNKAYGKKNYYDALKYFTKATDLKPNYDAAWYMRGLILNNLTRYSEALDAFMKALESNIENEEAWYSMGLALYSLGRYKEEIECYDKAIELKRDFLNAWNNKGTTLLQLERYEKAVECYDEILRQNNNFKMAWNNKGIALKKLKRTDEAIECFTKAIKIDPNYLDAWFNKGLILLDKKRYKRAYHCFEAVLGMDSQNVQVLYHKAKTLEGVGQFTKAVECYDNMIAIDSRFYAAKRRKKKALKYLEQKGDSSLDEEFFRLGPDMADEYKVMSMMTEKERILVKKKVSHADEISGEVISKETETPEKIEKETVEEILPIAEDTTPILPLEPAYEEPQDTHEVITQPDQTALSAEAEALQEMKSKLEQKEHDLEQMEAWLKERYETFEKERKEMDLTEERKLVAKGKEELEKEKEILRKEKTRLAGQTKGVAKATQNLSSKESDLRAKEEELESRFDDIERRTKKMTLKEKELEKTALKLKKRQDELEEKAGILKDKLRNLQENERLQKEVIAEVVQDEGLASYPPSEGEKALEKEPREVITKEIKPKISTLEEEGIGDILGIQKTPYDKEVLALYSLGHFYDAQKRIEEILGLGLESKLLWNIKGNLLRANGDLEEANDCFEKALKLDQNYEVSLVNLMSLNIDLGRFEKAIGWCQKVLAQRPKDEKLSIQKALLEARRGQIDEAISTINSLLKINNELEVVWNLKGILMYHLNQNDDALECYEKALEINSHYFAARNNMGVVFHNNKQFDDALKCFESASKLKSDRLIEQNRSTTQKELGQSVGVKESQPETEAGGIVAKIFDEVVTSTPTVSEDIDEIENEEPVEAEEVHEVEAIEETQTTPETETSLFMCPSCGAFVGESATKCERCGYDFEAEEEELEEEVIEEEVIEKEAKGKKAPDEKSKEDIIKALMNISGIGLSKAEALYEAGYMGQDDLREASISELAEVAGIGRTLAKIIKKRLDSKKFKEG